MTQSKQEAEEWLPCVPECGKTVHDGELLHAMLCPVKFRPAVAARLAERDEKIAELRGLLDLHNLHELVGPSGECACPSCNLHHRFADLRAWLAAAEGDNKFWQEQVAQRDKQRLELLDKVAAAEQRAEEWEETANRFCRDAVFYRNLLDQVAALLGPNVYVSEDGSIQDSPIRLKIPELVRAELAAKDPKQSP